MDNPEHDASDHGCRWCGGITQLQTIATVIVEVKILKGDLSYLSSHKRLSSGG